MVNVQIVVSVCTGIPSVFAGVNIRFLLCLDPDHPIANYFWCSPAGDLSCQTYQDQEHRNVTNDSVSLPNVVTQHMSHMPCNHERRVLGSAYGKADSPPNPIFRHIDWRPPNKVLPPAVLTSVVLDVARLLSLSIIRYHLCSVSGHQQSKTATQISQIEASMDLEYASNQSHIFGPSTPKSLGGGISPNEPVAGPHATQHETPEDSICYECRQVDWDSLPFLARTLEKKNTAQRLWTIRIIEANHEQLAASPCKICRILSVVMPRSLDQSEWYVEARPLLNSSVYSLPYHWRTKRNITTLQVCPRGKNTLKETSGSRCLAVIRNGDGSSSRTIPPRSIDYHWPKLLAQLCEKDHKGRCRLDSPYPVSVPGLKVIKVSSRTVIQAPAGCRYVALSYVWGKQPDVSPTLHLQCPPPLIEDAISVTKAMGYEYLWIDRYVSI